MSQVRVRLKKDPSRVRMMTARSFEVNRSKWELAPEEGTDPNDQSDIAIEINRSKKKGVSGAALVTADSDHRIGGANETEFVTVTVSELSKPVAQTATLVTEDLGIETLRDEYAIKFGKPADKRWKADRIKSELEKLTQQ